MEVQQLRLFFFFPLFFQPQAYNYNDHGISEQWMQTFVGKTSAEAEAGDSNTGGRNSNSDSNSTSDSGRTTDNGSCPALSDEASRTQVRGEHLQEGWG